MLPIVALSLAVGVVYAGPEWTFPNRVYVAGSDPFAIAVADFNGDGWRDLAVANSEDDDLSVFLGLGGGRFGPQARYPTGEVPVSVAAADLDGDGVVDLAVANRLTDYVSVLRGRGDGTFAPQVRYTAGDSPGPVVVGDFNRDGRPDLLTTNLLSHDVSFLAGRGDGTFGAPVFSAAGQWPIFVAPGDFNQDGILDLAVADLYSRQVSPVEFAGDVLVLLGRGDGTFGPARGFRAGFVPVSVAAGDLNADGLLDLAVVNYRSDDVSVLLGSGDGTFAPQRRFRAGDYPLHVAIADLDQDGYQDLALGDLGFDGVPILRGRGDGTFDPQVHALAGLEPVFVAVEDLDGNGVPDLVVANFDSDDISVLLGLGGGRFPSAPRYEAGRSPWDIAAGDFNRDGIPDIAVANFGSDFSYPFPHKYWVSVLLGLETGGFHPQALIESVPGTESIAVADFNQDHAQDLAVGGAWVGILEGQGDGGFGTPKLLPGGFSKAIATADFNRDGLPDLAAIALVAGFGEPAETLIWLGVGDGRFALRGSFPVGLTPFRIAPGDLNGDGIPDLVVANEAFWHSLYGGPPETGDLSVLLGLGDGTFAPERRYPAGRRPSAVAIGDFDRDGRQDVAVVNSGSRDVWVRPGVGNGELGPETRYPVGRFPRGVVAADFDADGTLDLAVANQGNSVSILAGNGDGTFISEVRFATGTIPNALVAGDFNGDGRPDLAVANFGAWFGDVTLLLNESPPPNQPPLAVIRTRPRWECTSPEGATVLLDGTGSTDPDSPGASDNGTVSFEWYRDFGLPSEGLLGITKMLEVSLPLGVHQITLRVRDDDGATDTETVVVVVEDTTPPTLDVVVNPSLLWPPNHRLVEVHVDAKANDSCGPSAVVLEDASSNEPADGQGEGASLEAPDIQGADFGSADLRIYLRAERSGAVGARTYLLRYKAVDRYGNVKTAQATVLVPHDLGRARQRP